MARNKVQFQKGLSEAEFRRLYGGEEQCLALVIAWRWPNGFECPACGGARHCHLKPSRSYPRGLFQCSGCKRQTSPIAGTIFASTKLPLTIWFSAMYHLTQSKQGISSIELGRRLGVTQTTAWKIKHKLAQVMMEREAQKPLDGRVEMDDAYLGGARSGGKRGRGSPGKRPFVAAVETTDDGKPKRIKLRQVKRFTKKAIKAMAEQHLKKTARRHRWARLLSWHCGCRNCARAFDRQLTRALGKAAEVQVGQYRARQYQERDHRYLSRRPQARRPHVRRVRVSLQSTL